MRHANTERTSRQLATFYTNVDCPTQAEGGSTRDDFYGVLIPVHPFFLH